MCYKKKVLNWSEINIYKKDNFSKNTYTIEEARDLRVPRLDRAIKSIRHSTVANDVKRSNVRLRRNLAKKNVNTSPWMARVHYHNNIEQNRNAIEWILKASWINTQIFEYLRSLECAWKFIKSYDTMHLQSELARIGRQFVSRLFRFAIKIFLRRTANFFSNRNCPRPPIG